MADAVWALCAAGFATFFFSFSQLANHGPLDRNRLLLIVIEAIAATASPLIWAASRENGVISSIGWMIGWAIFICIILLGVGIWDAGPAIRRWSTGFTLAASGLIVTLSFTM